MPKTYTVKEVADILGFSTNSIYTFLKEKRLRGVRIGKGRFRIPETELARVLHLSKSQGSAPSESLGQFNTPQADSSVIVSSSTRSVVRLGDILAPNIFDWFAGLAAIISGVSLFLFNSSLVRPEASGFASVIFAVRVILIATGVGVIATAVLTQSTGWHKLFHALLGLLGLINGILFFRGGDIDGAIVYGMMGVVLWIGLIFHPEGILSLGIYTSLLAILFPVWILAYAESPAVMTIAHVIGVSPQWLGIAVTVASISFIALFWTGRRGLHPAFVAAGVLTSAMCFGGAVWYGQMQYWSRAFFFIILGFFLGLAPYWNWLCQSTPRRQRLLLNGLLTGVGGALLLATFVVNLLQRHVWVQMKVEFSNRVMTAQNILTAAVEAAQSSAVVTAANTAVAESLGRNDTESLIAASKLLYESNPVVRRVVFLNAAGDGVSLYPYGTFDQPNFAFREYFIQARDTRSVYVSNIFQSAVDNVGRYVLVVAAPVFSPKGSFAGVLAVSVDLERLGLRLQQLAVESRGEYFVIVDADKKIISHPDSSRIGMTVPENDLISRVSVGAKGVGEGVLHGGVLGLIAYGPIERFNWMVTLRMPAESVYAATANTVVWVFGIVAFVLATGVVFACMMKLRWTEQPKGGP